MEERAESREYSGKRLSGFMKFLIILILVTALAFFGMVTAVAGLIGRISESAADKPHLVLLRLEGPIFDSEPHLTLMAEIARDKNCRGILLRVESPGGAVGSSQEIYGALKRLRDNGMPLVVSFGNIAASGGYYAGLAGERIFANPGTLTGSIGVIFQFPEIEKLMEKTGVSLQTVKSGTFKDAGNFTRKATEDELRYFQNVIDDTYAQFLGDVAKNRGLDPDSLRPFADGRVFTGRQALQAGLIDTLGGLDDARAYLVSRAGVEEDIPWVVVPRPKSRLEKFIDPEARSGVAGLSDLIVSARDRLAPGAFFLWP
jgi:protease IV